MPDARVNGVRLHYEEYGSGTPILCIHGTGSSSELWRPAARELAAHGRAIVYDRRGFSRSERPDPLVTDVHLHADDAAALLDALDAAPAIVVGRSHGGEIAVDLALRHGDRVRALALLEGGGSALSQTLLRWLEELDRAVFAAAARDVDTVGEVLLRRVLGDEAWEEVPEDFRRVFAGNGPAIVAERRGGVLGADAETLGTIRQPTLLVSAGDSPPEIRAAMHAMAEAMPRARLETVEGGHLISPSHPVVRAFIDGLRAAA